MSATLKLLLLVFITAPASAQSRAVDELPGFSPETDLQASTPVPQPIAPATGKSTELPAEDAFLVKPDAEHEPGAELFDLFDETRSKTPRSSKPKKIPYFEIVKKEATAQDVSIYLILAVIQKESSFDPKAYNPSGAVGLMQMLPATAKYLGLKNPKALWSPEVNIKYGVKYLNVLEKEFGTQDTLSFAKCHTSDIGFTNILAAYNAGPGNVRKYNGVPPFKETKRYVELVTEYFHAFEQLLPAF